LISQLIDIITHVVFVHRHLCNQAFSSDTKYIHTHNKVYTCNLLSHTVRLYESLQSWNSNSCHLCICLPV